MNDRRLLGVAVAVALVFATGWLWRAAGDAAPDRSQVSVGEPASVDGVEYRLRSVTSAERVMTSSDRPIVAVKGAVLVVATVDYDASGATGRVSCRFELVAGETTWPSEWGYYPPPGGGSVSCGPGTTGTVSVLFEVPRGFLAQIQGVGVLNPGGTVPILPGHPA